MDFHWGFTGQNFVAQKSLIIRKPREMNGMASSLFILEISKGEKKLDAYEENLQQPCNRKSLTKGEKQQL